MKPAPSIASPPGAAALPSPGRQWRVIAAREIRGAMLNRLIHLLSAATLLVGLAPLWGDHPGESAPYFLVQAILYLVPLFTLLIGVGSVQGEFEERAFLLSQPVGRLTIVLGKWAALLLLVALASSLLVLPSALGESALTPLWLLWINAVETGGVFLALGMACGLSTSDRVKAHLAALCLWFVLIAGLNLLALGTAGLLDASLWLFLLMANPLDAFRIGALFSLDRVPLEAGQIPAVGQWWLAHPQAWLLLLSGAWSAAALGWCRYRLRRADG